VIYSVVSVVFASSTTTALFVGLSFMVIVVSGIIFLFHRDGFRGAGSCVVALAISAAEG
jgi:hypothetical protein